MSLAVRLESFFLMEEVGQSAKVQILKTNS